MIYEDLNKLPEGYQLLVHKMSMLTKFHDNGFGDFIETQYNPEIFDHIVSTTCCDIPGQETFLQSCNTQEFDSNHDHLIYSTWFPAINLLSEIQ